MMAGFFRSIRIGLILASCASITPQSAVARCRPSIPQATLLESIPSEAESSEVIAKVLILSIGKDPNNESLPFEINYALAFVVEAIKGVRKGELILIHGNSDICAISLYSDIHSGKEGYVAGEFDSNKILRGFWDKKYERK